MKPDACIDPHLTRHDTLVLKNLLQDIDRGTKLLQIQAVNGKAAKYKQHGAVVAQSTIAPPSKSSDDQMTIKALEALNDPKHEDFSPAVFAAWDLKDVELPTILDRFLLQPYIKWARTVVRIETDVLMLTHLILYFTTSVPSALYLYYRFSWLQGLFHVLMQLYYAGTYTLMMHQHIHMHGVLSKKYAWFDLSFPYILYPLMGHTWNSYFYHHVKHHHVEGNGPNDISSTVRYQRDNLLHFIYYIARFFFFFIWLDLPLYFIWKNKPFTALKASISELTNHVSICLLAIYVSSRATIFVFMVPFLMLRMGLMVGNWGQHALMDEIDTDSDFRSSITLIDVASNRYCYNDGYHTSHHLNPRRHWREHPAVFLKQKDRYTQERALVFRNINYIMITIKLLQGDYTYLAKCMVPLGPQIGMSLEQKAAMLKIKARRFTEEEISKKFHKN